jgi:hypothetical protein
VQIVSGAARAALRGAGWFPGRIVDIDSQLSALANEGYVVSPLVRDFLREYAGLQIAFERNGRPDKAWFDAAQALRWIDRPWVDSYVERVKTNLAPVGYAHTDHLAVLAGDDGCFYGGYDDFLARLGGRPLEMIDTLVTGSAEALDA